MASATSCSTMHSAAAQSKGHPHFISRSCPPDPITAIQSNQVHLIRLSHHKFQATATQILYKSATSNPERLMDDVIMLTSDAGVILGRIPKNLSDEGVDEWLESFLEYISGSEEAAWWHTEYAGPWTCYVFVPMNKDRTKWMYTNTENGRLRPLKILGAMDTYAQTKPWLVQLPGWEKAEIHVANIWGKCYVPTSSVSKAWRRQQETLQQESLQQETLQQGTLDGWRWTEIKFTWDPDRQVRQVRMRDEEWPDEVLVETEEMSLI